MIKHVAPDKKNEIIARIEKLELSHKIINRKIEKLNDANNATTTIPDTIVNNIIIMD